jgi:arsenate reductase (glutaredoxin)
VKVYGIKNCDTVKKALKKLESSGVDYEFVDFKKTPPTQALLKKAKSFLGELPVNKRGTTFRKIKEEYENANEATQMEILVENSSAIKRPLVEVKNKIIAIGFKDDWDFIN